VLTLAASLDRASGHVLAAAIVRAAAGRDCRLSPPSAVTEVAGQGVVGMVGGLHAILRLHAAQEDETCLSLGNPATATAGRPA
jgi:cation transport ATPase